jgi:hypothetical protein
LEPSCLQCLLLTSKRRARCLPVSAVRLSSPSPTCDWKHLLPFQLQQLQAVDEPGLSRLGEVLFLQAKTPETAPFATARRMALPFDVPPVCMMGGSRRENQLATSDDTMTRAPKITVDRRAVQLVGEKTGTSDTNPSLGDRRVACAGLHRSTSSRARRRRAYHGSILTETAT